MNQSKVGFGALFALVCLIAGLAGGCSQDRAIAVRKLNEGLKAYERGQTMTAAEKIEEAAETDPTFAKPRYQAAQIYEIDLNEPKEAERHYRAAVDLESDNTDFTYGLGRVLAKQGDYEEAIEYYEKTIANDENHAKAWFRLALSQRALGNDFEAIESFTKSIEANPRMKMDSDDSGGAHYHALADLYVEFGFYDKALRVYENGILNNEKSPRLLQGRGVAQLQLERYEDAVESFEKVLEVDPSSTSALYNIGVAREAMGKPEEAMSALEKFLENARPGENRSRIAAAQGMMNKIKKQLEK